MSAHDLTSGSLWPLLVYVAAVVLLIAGLLAFSSVLGERHAGRATGEPFESGIVPTGDARLRFSAQFYLVAMMFVIFDLEAAFLFAWAVSARDTGWAGYAEALLFIGVLATALAYLWRVGALDWTPRRSRGPRRGAR